MAVLSLALVGRMMHFGGWYRAGLLLGVGLFVYHLWLIRERDRDALAPLPDQSVFRYGHICRHCAELPPPVSSPGALGRFALDPRFARRSFERASKGYDACAVLQTEVRALLLARLDFTSLKPRVILDAGAGTGHASRALKKRYPGARVIAVDFALGMLRSAAAQSGWLRSFERGWQVTPAHCHLPALRGSDLHTVHFGASRAVC